MIHTILIVIKKLKIHSNILIIYYFDLIKNIILKVYWYNLFLVNYIYI